MDTRQVLQPIIEVVLLAIVPLVLLVTGVISGKYRFLLLGAIAVVSIADVIISGNSTQELGIRMDNITSALVWYFGLAILGVVCIVDYARFKKIPPFENWRRDPHLLFWFIPISIAQQFVFFSFILLRLNALLPVAVAVIINTLIFSCAHLMYRPKRRAFVATLLAGLGFSVLYSIIPNVIIGSLVHMVLNYTVVRMNLFDFPKA